jgi:hypothetical protein
MMLFVMQFSRESLFCVSDMPTVLHVWFLYYLGLRGNLVSKALGYKAVGRGFEARWGGILNLPNPSGRARPWGLLSL